MGGQPAQIFFLTALPSGGETPAIPRQLGDQLQSEGSLMPKRAISEDWLAVLIGFVLALFVGVGLITRIPWPIFGWLR